MMLVQEVQDDSSEPFDLDALLARLRSYSQQEHELEERFNQLAKHLMVWLARQMSVHDQQNRKLVETSGRNKELEQLNKELRVQNDKLQQRVYELEEKAKREQVWKEDPHSTRSGSAAPKSERRWVTPKHIYLHNGGESTHSVKSTPILYQTGPGRRETPSGRIEINEMPIIPSPSTTMQAIFPSVKAIARVFDGDISYYRKGKGARSPRRSQSFGR